MSAPTNLESSRIHAVSIASHGNTCYQQIWAGIDDTDLNLFSGFLSALVDLGKEFRLGEDDNGDVTFIEKKGYGLAIKEKEGMIYSLIFDWAWNENSYKLHDIMRRYLKKIRQTFESTYPDPLSKNLNTYNNFSEKLSDIFGQEGQPRIKI